MLLRARDLMTPTPITLRPEARFLEIQHLFVEAQIGGAPVIDDRGVVRGVVSASDLLAAVDQICDEDVDRAIDSNTLAERLDTLTAMDVAVPDAVWVLPDTPVSEVAQRMRATGTHRVLVGDGGQMLGMLTAFDLLRAVE